MPLFLLALATGMCTVPGTWAGPWIVRRTSFRVHRLALEAWIVPGGGLPIRGGLKAMAA